MESLDEETLFEELEQAKLKIEGLLLIFARGEHLN
mgnify:CR=1 FL=1